MPEPSPQPAETAIARVMETYRRAWETRDAALVLTIFTEDATYQENPFRALFTGHAEIARYWEEATRAHRDVRFCWQLVCQAGSLHVLEWSVQFTRQDVEKKFELRGVMFIELRGERIFRFREHWLRRENS